MRLIKYPSKEQWTELLKRPALNTENLFDTVRSIINKVRAEGDKAVLEYEATFDKVALSALAVTPEGPAARFPVGCAALRCSIAAQKIRHPMTKNPPLCCRSASSGCGQLC